MSARKAATTAYSGIAAALWMPAGSGTEVKTDRGIAERAVQTEQQEAAREHMPRKPS